MPHTDTRTKQRERDHFDGEGVYVIEFLEHSSTRLDRFIIRAILTMWDRHLKFMRPEWITGKKVLEACCGNPRDLHYYQKHGAEIAVGCEISHGVVLRGLSQRETFVLDESYINAFPHVIVADCERLPFADEEFDTLTVFQALHHLDAQSFFAEARRVLKPGGILLISDPNGANPLRAVADRVGRHTGVMSQDEKSSPPDDHGMRLADSGFEVLFRRSINLFGELGFLYTVLVEQKNPRIARVLRLGMPVLNAIDRVLETTVFRGFPSLSWRVVIAARRQ